MNVAITLLLMIPLLLSGPGEDVLNERPPVSRAELESRWGINCESAVDSVRVLAGFIRKVPDDAEVELPVNIGSLKDELALCAVIDQALWKGPGEPPGGHRRLHDILAEWSACRDEGRSCVLCADILIEIVYRLEAVEPRE